MRNYFILIYLLSLMGCGGTVTIVSSPPDAVVSIVEPGKEQPRPLGETPFNIETSELSESVNGGTIVLVVKKKGFDTKNFIVPNLSGGDLRIETYLSTNLSSNYKELNRVVSMILEAEGMILDKRYDEAMKVTEKIKELNQNIAAAHQLEATAMFLQKDLKKSRFALLRVIELEPENAGAQRLLDVIEKQLGLNQEKKGP